MLRKTGLRLAILALALPLVAARPGNLPHQAAVQAAALEKEFYIATGIVPN